MSDLTIQNLPARSVPKVSSPAPAQTSGSPSPLASQTLPAKSASSSGQSSLGNVNNIPPNGSISSNHSIGSNLEKLDAPVKLGGSSLSNIMTYRDSESGRLVVRVVDENSNAVISEFPSKTMLGNYPKIVSSSVTPDIDTKV